MKYKYTLGQKITVQIYDRWMGDADVPSIIAGFEHYVENGVPVYVIKTHWGETMGGIVETRISEHK